MISLIPATQSSQSQEMPEPEEVTDIITNLRQELQNNHLILKTDSQFSGKVKDNTCSINKLIRDLHTIDTLNNATWLEQIKKDLQRISLLGYGGTLIENKFILKSKNELQVYEHKMMNGWMTLKNIMVLEKATTIFQRNYYS